MSDNILRLVTALALVAILTACSEEREAVVVPPGFGLGVVESLAARGQAPFTPENFCYLIDDRGLSKASQILQAEGMTDDVELFRSLLVTYVSYAHVHGIRLTPGWWWPRLYEFNAHHAALMQRFRLDRGDLREVL